MRRSRRYAVLGAVALSASVLAGVTATAATATPTPSAAAARDGRIVFTDSDSGRVETANPDGTAIREVTPAGDTSSAPSWSPDASWIVFQSDHAGDDVRIFAIHPDGSGLRMVSHDAAGYLDFVPRFTPDGARIVYTRCRPDPPGGCALYSVRFDGSGRRALTAYDEGGAADFQSDVSPDGRRVAFVRYSYRGVIAQIWVMRIDGSHAHPITSPGLEAGLPRWTPDGHHLLVSSNIGHYGDNVYRIRDDGSGVTRLTSARFPHNAQWADPSPSGSHIVFTDDRAYPGIVGFDLFVMRPDGSHQHRITSADRLVEPDWGTAPLLPASSSPQAPRRASGTVRPTAPQGAFGRTLPSTGPPSQGLPKRW